SCSSCSRLCAVTIMRSSSTGSCTRAAAPAPGGDSCATAAPAPALPHHAATTTASCCPRKRIGPPPSAVPRRAAGVPGARPPQAPRGARITLSAAPPALGRDPFPDQRDACVVHHAAPQLGHHHRWIVAFHPVGQDRIVRPPRH